MAYILPHLISRVNLGAGESSNFYSSELVGIPLTSSLLDAAKFISNSLPNNESLRFDVLYKKDGTHYAFGYLYQQKKYGMINIQIIGSSVVKTIYVRNGEFYEL